MTHDEHATTIRATAEELFRAYELGTQSELGRAIIAHREALAGLEAALAAARTDNERLTAQEAEYAAIACDLYADEFCGPEEEFDEADADVLHSAAAKLAALAASPEAENTVAP